MNVSERKKTAFTRSDGIKKHTSILLEDIQPILTEYEVDFYELTKAKRSITDKIPVHVALFILQLSKLHMLKFLDFMYEHLVEGSFRVLYMDTDSFTFSLADDIPNLVKPVMQESFDSEKYKWFLKDDSAYEQRCPGKVSFSLILKNFQSR